MTSISLKTLNIESGKLADKKDFNFSGEIKAVSPKSIAYTIRWQLAKKRSGNAKVKSMSEISGTTAKPYKQKGTGNARQGSKRSVQFVGGRTCHGPTVRSYDFSIPKKIKSQALSDAIKIKLADESVILLSEAGKEKLKTKNVNKALIDNKINNALILLDLQNENNQRVALALRNLKNVKAVEINSVNVYDLLRFDNIIVEAKNFEEKILKLLK